MGSHRTLLTAGSNAKGQLGVGTYDDVHTFTPCQFAECAPNQLPDHATRVMHIVCGANHTVLLLKHVDGATSLWGAGDGRRGQLGPLCRQGPDAALEWTVFRQLVLPLPRGYTFKCAAAAWETTYVVLSCPERSDMLLSMGSNEFGALGVGEEMLDSGSARSRTNSGLRPGLDEPTQVDFDHIFPGVPTQHQRICIQSIRAGPRHVVVQLTTADSDADGSPPSSRTALVGWGASRHGQLGQHGGVRYLARPTPLPIDLDEDPMVSYALGNQHTVVLHASGRISALGSNKQGQIPSLDGPQTRFCGLGCTWNGTYIQTVDGDKHVLLSTGNGAQGQLGRSRGVDTSSAIDRVVGLPVDRTISSFVCGSEHVLVAMSSSSEEGNSNLVVGWGWNEHGNMGLGSLGNVPVPTQLWPREDVGMHNKHPQRVIGIWAGYATSWLLVE